MLRIGRIALLFICLFYSCNNKKFCEEIDFIYIDRAGVLHTQSGCKAVTKIYGGTQPVKPLKAGNVTKEMLNNICSQCVTEKQLLYLSDIADYRTRENIEFEEVDTLAIEEDIEDGSEYDE